MIYFIRAGASGPIKIGFADDPAQRLVALQNSHWENLTLLRVIDGPKDLEKRYHETFKSGHIRSEWFKFDARMLTIDSDISEWPRHCSNPFGARQRNPALVDAIASAGGAAALGRKLGRSRQAVSLWDRAPAEMILLIEQISGVDRRVLRPDIYP